jgi:hypothetical protein
MFSLLQFMDIFMTEECSDSMAFDLWIVLPFFLGYFSWRFLFVGFDLTSRYNRICKEKSLSENDCCQQSDTDNDYCARALQDLRQELLKEKQLVAQAARCK